MRFKDFLALEEHPFGKPKDQGMKSAIKDIAGSIAPKQGAIGRIHQNAPGPAHPCGIMNLTPPKKVPHLIDIKI